MREVTITLDDETARWARLEAARHHTSLSRWISLLLEEQRRSGAEYEQDRDASLDRVGAALEPTGSSLPSRSELHER